MAKRGVSTKTTKSLFSLSGNQCAFQGCTQKMVEGTNVIGEMCHIIGLNQGSARHGLESLDEEQVNGFENLIVLCGNCHKKIDDNPDIYTPGILRKMKSDHENGNQSTPFEISDDAIDTARDQYIYMYFSGDNHQIQIGKADSINFINAPIAVGPPQNTQEEIDQEIIRIDKVFFGDEDISNFQILKFISQPMTQDAKIRKGELEKIFENAQVIVKKLKDSYTYPKKLNNINYEYIGDQLVYKYKSYSGIRFYSLLDIYGNIANYFVCNWDKVYIRHIIEFIWASFIYTVNTHQAIIGYKNTITLLNFDNKVLQGSDDGFMEDQVWFTEKYICETIKSGEIRKINDAVKIIFNDFSVYTKDTYNDKINFDKRIDECSAYFTE